MPVLVKKSEKIWENTLFKCKEVRQQFIPSLPQNKKKFNLLFHDLKFHPNCPNKVLLWLQQPLPHVKLVLIQAPRQNDKFWVMFTLTHHFFQFLKSWNLLRKQLQLCCPPFQNQMKLSFLLLPIHILTATIATKGMLQKTAWLSLKTNKMLLFLRAWWVTKMARFCNRWC